MHEKRFKKLLEELEKYRQDCSNLVIQKWELISICNEISIVIAEMRKQEVQYEMTNDEIEKVKWVYTYLRNVVGN